MPNRISVDVIDNPGQHRFELELEPEPGDENIAAANYRRDENGHIVLTQTEVPSTYGGRGFASKCPFMGHGLPIIPIMRSSWQVVQNVRFQAMDNPAERSHWAPRRQGSCSVRAGGNFSMHCGSLNWMLFLGNATGDPQALSETGYKDEEKTLCNGY